MEPNHFAPHRGTMPSSAEAASLHSLRLHAEQLASYFSSWSADLERREAELTAEQAGREQELRGMRMWVAGQLTLFRDVVEQLRDQVGRLRNGPAEPVSFSNDSDLHQIEAHLDRVERQLKRSPHQGDSSHRLSDTQSPGHAPPDSEDLLRWREALETRERALECAQGELEAVYRETQQIHESAEHLVRHASGDRSSVFATASTPPDSLASKMQAMEEAERRLRRRYTQILEEKTKRSAAQAGTIPSAAKRESSDLMEQIDRLQSALSRAQTRSKAA
ncbi:MAG: hypothetical protein P8K78_10285 [Pirellulales bacterium]|nr:hypothetical protein [Pirellulales bacterium]